MTAVLVISTVCRIGAGQVGADAGRDMTILDLTKATVVCGGSGFLVYSYPVVSQVILIGMLALLWLLYAWKTFGHRSNARPRK